MSQKIAIQGEPASFHSIAAAKFFGPDIELVCRDTFGQTFKAVLDNQADFGVVAIENSLYGSINEVYDLLLKHNLWLCGEVYLRIEQCLIGLPDTRLEDIKEVHSHPVALAQCEEFLNSKLPRATRFESFDTAGSVADIKKWNDPARAALGSRAAAELHGLSVIEAEVETNKENYTRFVVLQQEHKVERSADKASLILTTSHRPGALYRALGVFADRRMNLTKLQSQPIVGKAWHYIFHVDVAASSVSADFVAAVKELEEQGCNVALLGSYKSA